MSASTSRAMRSTRLTRAPTRRCEPSTTIPSQEQRVNSGPKGSGDRRGGLSLRGASLEPDRGAVGLTSRAPSGAAILRLRDRRGATARALDAVRGLRVAHEVSEISFASFGSCSSWFVTLTWRSSRQHARQRRISRFTGVSGDAGARVGRRAPTARTRTGSRHVGNAALRAAAELRDGSDPGVGSAAPTDVEDDDRIVLERRRAVRVRVAADPA
jgi:hypothetical protein